MNISYFDHMFMINSKDIQFTLFENMYKSGHGVGLQTNHKDSTVIEKQCNLIYKNVVELQNMLK